jgi:hypothetical protein
VPNPRRCKLLPQLQPFHSHRPISLAQAICVRPQASSFPMHGSVSTLQARGCISLSTDSLVKCFQLPAQTGTLLLQTAKAVLPQVPQQRTAPIFLRRVIDGG